METLPPELVMNKNEEPETPGCLLTGAWHPFWHPLSFYAAVTCSDLKHNTDSDGKVELNQPLGSSGWALSSSCFLHPGDFSSAIQTFFPTPGISAVQFSALQADAATGAGSPGRCREDASGVQWGCLAGVGFYSISPTLLQSHAPVCVPRLQLGRAGGGWEGAA